MFDTLDERTKVSCHHVLSATENLAYFQASDTYSDLRRFLQHVGEEHGSGEGTEDGDKEDDDDDDDDDE